MTDSTRQTGNPTVMTLAILLMLLIFLGAVADLFIKRFQVGDLFPAYSTLRTDPFGSKILAESFSATGHEVRRNYKPLPQASLPDNTTLIMAGIRSMPGATISEIILPFVARGNRVLLSFTPQNPTSYQDTVEENSCQDDQDNQVDAETLSEEPKQNNDQEKSLVFNELTGFQTDTFILAENESDSNLIQTANGTITGVNISVPWNSARYFSELDPAWEVILSLSNKPVLIGRPWEDGYIFIASDSYFLSNESMWLDRQSLLLVSLAGDNSLLIFDETHHGIQMQMSISALIRQFNLHGVIAGLFLLAILFLWRNSMPLLNPQHSLKAQSQRGEKRDQFSGLVNIIRRNPPKNLLLICLEKYAASNQELWKKHPEAVKKIMGIGQNSDKKQLLENYKKICKLIKDFSMEKH